MLRRRSLMYSKKLLPSAYQQVEYLESTGTQYIDTGYIPKNNTTISVKFYNNSESGKGFRCVYGCQTDVSNGRSYLVIGQNANVFQANIGNNSYYSQFTTNAIGEFIQKVSASNKTWEINGISVTGDTGSGSVPFRNLTASNCAYPLFLFTRNNAGIPYQSSTGTYPYMKGKIYYFKAEENSIKLNLIPCYRKSDNVAGMYDLVNNVFYTNSGTGTFIVGPNVN